ncbi:MAG: universal stress protein [Bacteroidales bacterium]|nr:universal stress protein [Bacteroidales bacterium]
MKNILVPVDFSKDSINALKHAIAIANKLKASLRILHVRKNKNYDSPFVIEGKENEYAKTVVEFCDNLVSTYKPKYKGKGTFDYLIRVGKIYKIITEQAELDNASLIVMGTHGVSGFEELWLGSNSFRVVGKSPCPVITVRNGFKKDKISKIVLPIDANRETRIKVPYTADLAEAFNAEVHIISVRTTERADIVKRLKNYATQASDYLEKRNITVIRDDIKGSNLAEITYTYGVHHGADLISIVSNQRGTPVNMPISTTAQHMVNHSPIPVLSIHPDYKMA